MSDSREFFGRLHEVWAEHGCAICGSNPPRDAPDGFRLEMHSLNRGFGRHDSCDPLEYVALCGDLTECKAHWRVTTYRLDIYRNQNGRLVWSDRAGGRGLCRFPVEFRGETSSRDGRSAEAHNPPHTVFGPAGGEPVHEIPLEVLDVSPEPSPLGSVTPAAPAPTRGGTPARGEVVPTGGVSDAAGRLSAIRALMEYATRSHLAASLLLLEAFEREDHLQFGITWTTYVAEHLGIVKGTASKMLLVARTFRGAWMDLPQDQQSNLSLERAYHAALLVGMGADPDEALSKAVTTPVSHLIAERRGEEPSDRRKMVCAECGEATWHTCRAAR